MKRLMTAFLCVSLAIPSFFVSIAAAQKSKQVTTPPAPVPAPILTGKRVFIANAGGDAPGYDSPLFTGGPDRTYNQFYAVVKNWGRYELVDSPVNADLLFEIRLTAPPYGRVDSVWSQAFDPQIRLEIREPKTQALLWGFTEHMQWAVLLDNRDKNFDQASARIVTDVRKLVDSAVEAGAAAKPKA